MRRLPLVLLLLLPSCNGGGPPIPPPTPPPPIEPPIEMLLRADGPELVTLEGDSVEHLGAIPCCRATTRADEVPQPMAIRQDGEEVLTGWPIAINPEWRGYVHSLVGDRTVFFHGRLGPFFGSETAEPEWADVGGAYQLVDGKADLEAFNPAFWSRVHGWGEETCLAGDYIEFDLVDRWWAKQQVIPNPMRAEWNIQGYSMNLHVGRQAIEPGSYEDLWLEQVVRVLGPLPCVIWQDGNEVGLGPYDPRWTTSMLERVRHHERTVGNNVVHLFATNSHDPTAEASVDYVERHQHRPVSAPVNGKPTMVNEYNPSPALSGAEVYSRFCQARSASTNFWFWRHTMEQEEMEEALTLMATGCQPLPTPPPAECTLPTPTAREAAAMGMDPTINVQREVPGVGTLDTDIQITKGIGATPIATFGLDYYCDARVAWPEACGTRRRGPVAPPGHPQRLACEQHFLEAPCPRFRMDSCTGGVGQCPITFDPFIVIDGVNQNHPRNVAAGCSEVYEKDGQGRVLSGEWWWASAHGKGYIRAEAFDGSVFGVSNFEIDQ